MSVTQRINTYTHTGKQVLGEKADKGSQAGIKGTFLSDCVAPLQPQLMINLSVRPEEKGDTIGPKTKHSK